VDFLIRDLVAEKIIETRGDTIDIPGRSKELGGSEGELARTIETRFREAGLQTPAVSELIRSIAQKPKVIEGVIGFLVKRGTLVRIAEGVYLHADVLGEAKGKLEAHRGRTADVGFFKELYGISRKVVIPLLELFDREGLTKRLGDQRTVL
jgi:selenocysteine-specific elongation factor